MANSFINSAVAAIATLYVATTIIKIGNNIRRLWICGGERVLTSISLILINDHINDHFMHAEVFCLLQCLQHSRGLISRAIKLNTIKLQSSK